MIIMKENEEGMKLQVKIKSSISIVAALITFFLAAACAQAAQDEIAEFYRGKTIRFIVGWSPGGGYDTYARLVAASLAKNLECTIIVQNMPGAGGQIAMNYMYNSAKKNGLYLSITPVGLPLTQALGAKGVKFDCSEFNWLASVVQDTHIIGVSPESHIKTLGDLAKSQKVLAATTEVTSPMGQPLIMAAEALGINNMRIVPGYAGTTECILAAKRGEVQFTAGSVHHFEKGNELLRPIVAISSKRRTELPEVPALTEFEIKKNAERMLEVLFNCRSTGRAIITSPGVSEEKVAFLRKQIMKSLQNPELVEKANKVELSVEPLSGEAVQELATKAVKLTSEELKQLKMLFFQKYL